MALPDLPLPADELAMQTPERCRHLLSTSALTPAMLRQLEELTYECIAQRYPDDPGSLLNLRFREGQCKRAAFQRVFDAAFDQLSHDGLSFLERVRGAVVEARVQEIEDTLYLQRRSPHLVRAQDRIDLTLLEHISADTALQA